MSEKANGKVYGTLSSAPVPAWDRETDLRSAQAQVAERVNEHAHDRGRVMWLSAAEAAESQIDRIDDLGPGPVIGSDHVLWAWSTAQLSALSTAVEQAEGLLVFIEPTAGLGLRRALQLAATRWFRRTLGHDYRRDIPAELRSAGFVVTTQVRLRRGLVGDYVRGEARHFARPVTE